MEMMFRTIFAVQLIRKVWTIDNTCNINTWLLLRSVLLMDNDWYGCYDYVLTKSKMGRGEAINIGWNAYHSPSQTRLFCPAFLISATQPGLEMQAPGPSASVSSRSQVILWRFLDRCYNLSLLSTTMLMTQNVDENICILFFETTKVKVIAASHNYPNPCCMFSSGGVYPVKSLFRIIYWKENSQGRINHLQCDKRCIWDLALKLITDSQIVYFSVSVPTYIHVCQDTKGTFNSFYSIEGIIQLQSPNNQT